MPYHAMELQYNSVLKPAAQRPFEMDQPSVLRPYTLDFSDGKYRDHWYMVPHNTNFVLEYEYPPVPCFTQDFADALYFTSQPPKQFGIDVGYSPTEADEFIPAQPLMNDGHLLDNGYILDDSYQPIQAPLASPSSVVSDVESFHWNSVDVVENEANWDISALDPDSCNISDAGSFNWSVASTPNPHFQGDRLVKEKLNESVTLLQVSLEDSFRYPCGYKTCTKSFKRKEHAKRHYMTKHRPKQFRLQCEFCGKDTFTRTDNLNAHRRLHARSRPKPSSGVHFVPEALEALQRRKKPSLRHEKLIHMVA